MDALRADLERAKAQAAGVGKEIGDSVGKGVEEGAKKADTSLTKIAQSIIRVKGIIFGVVATLGVVVAAVVAVVSAVKQWVNAQEEAAKAAAKTADEINRINEAVKQGLGRSASELFPSDSQEALDQKIEDIKQGARKQIEEIREAQAKIGKVELEERIKRGREREKTPFKGLNADYDNAQVKKQLQEDINLYRVAYGQAIPDIQKTAQNKIDKARAEFADKATKKAIDAVKAEEEASRKSGDELRANAEKNADLEYQNWLRIWESMEEKEKQSDERRKAAAKEAIDNAKIIRDVIQSASDSLLGAVSAFNGMNQGVNGVGQSAQFLAQKIEGLTRIGESIRAQQAGSSSGTTSFEGGF